MSFHKLFEKQTAKSKKQTANSGTFFIKLLFAFCFLPFAVLLAQTPQESSCITCHKLLAGELLAPVTARENDIHA
jgi:hypothetical protein